ncbi:hypothetical protein HMI54_015177 [Coelomomyces lativittatus]|nr:hypothetical protein HMI56_006133 [Coelomomyces lativittatus]KAJ1517885.1 hypothetical protein HMI55_005203 [Coelomomyces lativittatus]KAJ1518536.1 hypothetical protein HMI54_015177 [Coelomomyces lativittatus]
MNNTSLTQQSTTSPNIVELGWLQVFYASIFYLLNVVISLVCRLQLEMSLIISSVRCIIQLYCMGQVLQPVFLFYDNFLLVLGLSVILLLLGSFEAYVHSKYRYKHMFYVIFLSMAISCLIICPIGSYLTLRAIPWFNARVFIPSLGMILGNSISGVALGLRGCLTGLKEKKDQIEIRLAYGANRKEALLPVLRESLQIALTPTLNSMAVMGLISIPGQMTGQILAGANIQTAVHYQQILMLLIVSSTTLGTILTVLITLWLLVDSHYCLKSEAILERPFYLMGSLKRFLLNKISFSEVEYEPFLMHSVNSDYDSETEK